jgi:hypothetical protein
LIFFKTALFRPAFLTVSGRLDGKSAPCTRENLRGQRLYVDFGVRRARNAQRGPDAATVEPCVSPPQPVRRVHLTLLVFKSVTVRPLYMGAGGTKPGFA